MHINAEDVDTAVAKKNLRKFGRNGRSQYIQIIEYEQILIIFKPFYSSICQVKTQ